MGAGLIITIILIIFAGIGFAAYGLYRLGLINKPEYPPNAAIIVSFDNIRTQGYSIGVMVKQYENTADDRLKLRMKPISVPFNNRGKPEPQDSFDFIVRKERVIDLPAGSLDYNRHVKLILPDTSDKLHENIRNHPYGKFLAIFSEKTDEKDISIKLKRDKEVRLRGEYAMYEDEQNTVLDMIKRNLVDDQGNSPRGSLPSGSSSGGNKK